MMNVSVSWCDFHWTSLPNVHISSTVYSVLSNHTSHLSNSCQMSQLGRLSGRGFSGEVSRVWVCGFAHNLKTDQFSCCLKSSSNACLRPLINVGGPFLHHHTHTHTLLFTVVWLVKKTEVSSSWSGFYRDSRSTVFGLFCGNWDSSVYVCKVSVNEFICWINISSVCCYSVIIVCALGGTLDNWPWSEDILSSKHLSWVGYLFQYFILFYFTFYAP